MRILRMAVAISAVVMCGSAGAQSTPVADGENEAIEKKHTHNVIYKEPWTHFVLSGSGSREVAS
ncbi:MAG: hypothetical protein WA755_03980 [Candidatus Acidiferrales bacterium]